MFVHPLGLGARDESASFRRSVAGSRRQEWCGERCTRCVCRCTGPLTPPHRTEHRPTFQAVPTINSATDLLLDPPPSSTSTLCSNKPVSSRTRFALCCAEASHWPRAYRARTRYIPTGGLVDDAPRLR